MKTPTLETERIILRPLNVADADIIFESWTSDPDVAKYMNWNLHQNVNDTKEWLRMEEDNIEKSANYGWGFVLKETGELFGSGGLNYSEEYGMFELGYNIMKKYWNRGLTTEAAKVIIDFGSGTLGMNKFLARHANENPASGKVMEKVGFIYQKDGSYTSFDGKRSFESKEYILVIDNKK